MNISEQSSLMNSELNKNINHASVEEELKEVSPFLASHPKPDFTKNIAIPDGYFDKFPIELQSKLPKSRSRISIFDWARQYLLESKKVMAVCSILLLLSCGLVINHHNNRLIETTSISHPDIWLDDIDEDLIKETVNQSVNTASIKAEDTKKENFLLENCSEDELIN